MASLLEWHASQTPGLQKLRSPPTMVVVRGRPPEVESHGSSEQVTRGASPAESIHETRGAIHLDSSLPCLQDHGPRSGADFLQPPCGRSPGSGMSAGKTDWRWEGRVPPPGHEELFPGHFPAVQGEGEGEDEVPARGAILGDGFLGGARKDGCILGLPARREAVSPAKQCHVLREKYDDLVDMAHTPPAGPTTFTLHDGCSGASGDLEPSTVDCPGHHHALEATKVPAGFHPNFPGRGGSVCAERSLDVSRFESGGGR
mmetsp:Transcript_614/g.1917  ORF Transcript_614/g.1917 Transcript_614/m.1917 type:complete len:258 (+) Transcript_614:1410-2183(+)